MRIGQGIDFHRFIADQPMKLGGVTIESDVGLLGHSDADVLLHALSDAILGGCGLGDIGLHFPDNDPAYQGADSGLLLKEVLNLIQDSYFLVNVDLTIIGEKPKIHPYREEIRDHVATLLDIESSRVNVKATTSEGMGALGRAEGLCAMAVVLLEEKNGSL